MKAQLLFLACLLTFLCTGVRAQTQIGDDLTGRSSQRWFGSAVDLSADGNTLVIGEPDFLLVNDTSRVYIYQRDGDGWELEFNIFDPFGRSLGSAVAISADGRTVVMGAQANSNDEVPYVAIFNRSAAGQWSQRGQTIFAAGGNTKLGCSVAINAEGNRIIIAQCGGDAFAQVYELTGGEWTPRGDRLVESPRDDRSVAMSADGNRVAVGWRLGGTFLGGEAYVFQDNNGNYEQVGATLPSIGDNDDFGQDVDLSDDGKRLAIGIPGAESGRGVALLMEEINGQWVRVGQPVLGPSGNNRLGSAVALSGNGNVIAFGVPRADGDNGSVGAIERAGAVDALIANFPGEEDEALAAAIALNRDGSIIAFGAPEAEFNVGRVAVYELDVMTGTVTYAASDRIISPNPTSSLVSISGDPASLRDLTLTDLTGRTVLQPTDRTATVDLATLPAGLYLLTWREGENRFRQRIVRQ